MDITGSRRVTRDGSSLAFPLTDPPLRSALGAEPVRVIEGRRPLNDGEVAVSAALAKALGVSIDDNVPIDGTEMAVVGRFEDPSNLGTPAAIVAPGSIVNPEQVSILTSASQNRINLVVTHFAGLSLQADQRLLSLLAVYVLTAVAMIEIALLCAAAFTVLSQKKLRQFGLLAAIGATTRQVGQTLRFNALVLGLVGGVVGVFAGFGASVALRGQFERAVGWRMDGWSVPLLALLPFIVLAAGTAVVGAWWPSRHLAQVAPVEALSSRRPRVQPTGRKGAVGLGAFIFGAILLSFGIANSAPLAAIAGLVLAVVGVLLATPLLVASAGSIAPHLSLSPRIALRDIARHQSRSAASLAALVVAFAIPTAIIVTSASADANLESGPPNLPDNWAIVSVRGSAWGDIPVDFSPDEYQPVIANLKSSLPSAAITPIRFLADPISDDGRDGYVRTVLGFQVIEADHEEQAYSGRTFPLWIATPELLNAVGADPALARSVASLLGDPTQEIFIGEPVTYDSNGDLAGSVTPAPIDIIQYRDSPSTGCLRVRSMLTERRQSPVHGW
ncbi:MAG: FtsX-like permease family protein [Acidimicrobiales bacterium]